jgi:DNA topoisomerase I
VVRLEPSVAFVTLFGAMAKKFKARGGLKHIEVDALKIRRERRGDGFVYRSPRGGLVRDPRTLYRLKRLAVPPAYESVRYAEDPQAHIQAVGHDAAGRRQYRYHSRWDEVRERHKARHLADLTRLLPKLRSAISRHLKTKNPSREFALAAAIELIAATAIRAGSETYAREHGTRGAATLLKSNITIKDDHIALRFRGKGGKAVAKEVRSARLARALRRLIKLPGPRLFQYRAADGSIATVHRRDVNVFLQEMTSGKVTLKDFRTLTACGCALSELSVLDPKHTESGRRKQILGTLRSVANELANTPAVCRKSYVHAAIIKAFEAGDLANMASQKLAHSTTARERVLGQMFGRIAGP